MRRRRRCRPPGAPTTRGHGAEREQRRRRRHDADRRPAADACEASAPGARVRAGTWRSGPHGSATSADAGGLALVPCTVFHGHRSLASTARDRDRTYVSAWLLGRCLARASDAASRARGRSKHAARTGKQRDVDAREGQAAAVVAVIAVSPPCRPRPARPPTSRPVAVVILVRSERPGRAVAVLARTARTPRWPGKTSARTSDRDGTSLLASFVFVSSLALSRRRLVQMFPSMDQRVLYARRSRDVVQDSYHVLGPAKSCL